MTEASKQPIATPTIARIYAQQGKLPQSRDIYRRLLEATPDDPALTAELATVEARLSAQGEEPEPELDSLTVELSKQRLRCRWRVSDEGHVRARLVLGGDGQLTLRLAGFPADPEVATRDTSLDAASGSLQLSPPPGCSLVTAAIGLLDEDGTFVSIAHCDMVQL